MVYMVYVRRMAGTKTVGTPKPKKSCRSQDDIHCLKVLDIESTAHP
jgi:hypothetical protein